MRRYGYRPCRCGRRMRDVSRQCMACFRASRTPELERFWRFVDKNAGGCWVWTGGTSNGYGMFRTHRDGERMQIKAHRYSWELHNKQPVPRDRIICHHCDNPGCVNPAHLYAGTPLSNMQDKHARGRARYPIRSACRRGHLFTPENTRLEGLRARRCLTCEREKHSRYRFAARQKGAA